LEVVAWWLVAGGWWLQAEGREQEMRIGVCTAPEGVKSPVDGLDFVEGTVGNLLCPSDGEAAFAARLAAAEACPLPVEAANCLLPGELKTTGPDVDVAAVDAYITTVCRRARQMGLAMLVYGSGGSRRVPEGFDPAAAGDQIVEHLKRWGEIAAACEVTFVLEPLNLAECNIVNTVGEGAELVSRAGHPNARLLADTYHMAKDGDPPEAIRAAGGLIVHAHCAEAAGRVPVGLGGEDHRPYFRALKDIGYDGRIAIEATWEDFETQLPPAVAALRRQIEEA
jgi:sugar phosphate isomerase/epimerase